MLSVCLLGNFSILYNGKPTQGIDTPRLQSLLAYLLLHRAAPQYRSHLAFLFWPDTSETQARTNLRNLLHNLRHALPDSDCYLDIRLHTLQWRGDATMTFDVADFEAALDQAKQALGRNDSNSVQSALEEAVEQYSGDLLPNCYDDWIIPHRELLSQAFLNALEQLVWIFEEQHNYQKAIHHAHRLLRHDPLNEAMYRSLIRLHALSGDRASALRIFHACTTVLRRELDVDPSAATQEAYEHLLGSDSQIDLEAPMATAYSPLIGREREWAQLLQSWRSVLAGDQPHMVILSGEAGIGKTRLLEDLLQWVSRQGITCASTRCFSAEGDLAYAPVVAWLRSQPLPPLDDVWLAEIARLLPEIFTRRPDLPKPVALTESWQRQRLFEALSNAILGNKQPLLLAMDDLQWCGSDTLDWLHFLLRFEHHARLLVIGAYRPEEIESDHHLISLLQALRMEEQVTEIDLQPLDEAATQALAKCVAGVDLSKEDGQLLFLETEGNPLFLVETIRAGLPVHNQQAGKKTDDHSIPGNTSLPPKVQRVLQARLMQLTPPTRELAGLAATIGREFSFRLLAKSSGCDEDTLVHQLDELWQRRIIREHGAEAYDFTHDKLREVAYNSLSTVHRQLLHRHVAQALEILHSTDVSPVSHQVAIHYHRAGLSDKAIPYYLQAARVARKVFANEEAINILQHGLMLGNDIKPAAGEVGSVHIAQLSEELGDILEIRTQHEEALDAYKSSRSHVAVTDRITQARLYRKQGAVIREQRLYTNALETLQQAEKVLGRQPDQDDDPWWEEWLEVQVERVWAHYWLAQWQEMEELINTAQPVIQRRGNPANRLRLLWASCLMHLRRERYKVSDEMLADAREALSLSQELNNLKTRLEFTFELGFLHLWRHELDNSEEYLLIALHMAETSGFKQIHTLCLTYLTVLYRFRGLEEEVENYAQIAQQAAETAKMPDYVAASKGNQAWLAWRRKDLDTARQKSQEALTIWQQSPLVYPFQWQALWPLIGVSMAQNQEMETYNYSHALLAPTQQLLPDLLNTALVEVSQAVKMGHSKRIRHHLGCAIDIACQLGYL